MNAFVSTPHLLGLSVEKTIAVWFSPLPYNFPPGETVPLHSGGSECRLGAGVRLLYYNASVFHCWLKHHCAVIGCFAEFTFLPLGISSFWLCWHKSCDTLVFSPGHQSVSLSLSVFLGSYKPPGVLCVLCLDTVPTPGTPRTQWHCSVWPIVCDPGSGGNSWWILQYQPTWHQG